MICVKVQLMLCDDLDGQNGVKEEEIYVYMQLIEFSMYKKLCNIVKQLYSDLKKKRKRGSKYTKFFKNKKKIASSIASIQK